LLRCVIDLSVGGTIIQHFGWQATSFTIIPIAISLLTVIWRYINVNQNENLQQQQPFHPQQHVDKKIESEQKNLISTSTHISGDRQQQ
jgi:predicted MFS family arabinose efflux permease